MIVMVMAHATQKHRKLLDLSPFVEETYLEPQSCYTKTLWPKGVQVMVMMMMAMEMEMATEMVMVMGMTCMHSRV